MSASRTFGLRLSGFRFFREGRRLAGFVLVLCVLRGSASAYLVNGDFGNGLTDWEHTGNVSETGGQAVLTDGGTSHSVLFQASSWFQQLVQIEFDFRNLLSPDVPETRFPDAGFTSLYFIDNINDFDLENNVYDDVIALFDLDATGATLSTGAIGESDKGPEWQQYTVIVPCNYNYVIPVFEVFDQNLVDGDSAFLVDNVLLVPEPGTWLLFILGLALLGSSFLSALRKGHQPMTCRDR